MPKIKSFIYNMEDGSVILNLEPGTTMNNEKLSDDVVKRLADQGYQVKDKYGDEPKKIFEQLRGKTPNSGIFADEQIRVGGIQGFLTVSNSDSKDQLNLFVHLAKTLDAPGIMYKANKDIEGVTEVVASINPQEFKDAAKNLEKLKVAAKSAEQNEFITPSDESAWYSTKAIQEFRETNKNQKN